MTNVEQEDKKYIVNKLRNELRDISLAFNDLKNSWLIGNALKKINSVKVINELNSNALKSEDELFDLYLSNKTSLNMFASHMLNQKDFCDIDVLNEVITRELMSKKDDGVLNKPMVIKHRDILGCLKNVEITKDGIEIELAQLDVEQMSKNPSRAFPIKKLLLEKNIDLHSLRATDTLTMLFMQNIVMVKSNMVIKNQVENEQGFKNKRV